MSELSRVLGVGSTGGMVQSGSRSGERCFGELTVGSADLVVMASSDEMGVFTGGNGGKGGSGEEGRIGMEVMGADGRRSVPLGDGGNGGSGGEGRTGMEVKDGTERSLRGCCFRRNVNKPDRATDSNLVLEK